MDRNRYDQYDYILDGKRWKNNTINIESDTNANIDSDHVPVVCTFRCKIKKFKNMKKCNS